MFSLIPPGQNNRLNPFGSSATSIAEAVVEPKQKNAEYKKTFAVNRYTRITTKSSGFNAKFALVGIEFFSTIETEDFGILAAIEGLEVVITYQEKKHLARSTVTEVARIGDSRWEAKIQYLCLQD